MAALALSPKLKELCSRVEGVIRDQNNRFTEADRSKLDEDVRKGFISYATIEILSRALSTAGEEGNLHKYLIGSKLCFPDFKSSKEEVSLLLYEVQHEKLVSDASNDNVL
jgi:hypothetical protein